MRIDTVFFPYTKRIKHSSLWKKRTETMIKKDAAHDVSILNINLKSLKNCLQCTTYPLVPGWLGQQDFSNYVVAIQYTYCKGYVGLMGLQFWPYHIIRNHRPSA